jgi:hypothetical protein
MKLLKYLAILILLVILLLPVALFFSWKLSDAQKLDMLIMDKTVLKTETAEHRSVMWVLNHNRFLKSDNKPYSLSNDYYGFKPLKPYSGKKYEIKSIAIEEIDSLANAHDIAYFADTYGVFFNEWHNMKDYDRPSSIIYGGLNQNDYLLIREMLNRKKPVISESNLLGYPTSPLTSYKAQKLFQIKWTGWSGKHFHSLDTENNDELPTWIVDLYKRNNDGSWPFENAGIVLLNNRKKVIVLEEGKHLSENGFKIESSDAMASAYNLPSEAHSPCWFDIVIPENSNYEIISNFTLNLTNDASQELERNGIPSEFPAVMFGGEEFPFYYFSGDFSETEMPYYTAYLKGVTKLDQFFYVKDEDGRKEFFWEYYVPLVTSILEKYSKSRII